MLEFVVGCRDPRSVQHLRQGWRRTRFVEGVGNGDALARSEPDREGAGRHDQRSRQRRLVRVENKA